MAEQIERTYKKGEVIYWQNDYEMCLYDILYGDVALYQNYGTKDQVLVKQMSTGGYFGEMELVEAMPRTTTAVACERTQVKIFTAEDFSALFAEKPSMVLAIMQQMSARIRELTREYNNACRVVAEAMEAEKNGREKSKKLQRERQTLSDYYHSYWEQIGNKLADK